MSGADEDLTALIAEQRAENERLMLDWQRMPLPGRVSAERMRLAKRFNADGSQKATRVDRAIDRTLTSSYGPFAVREFPVENSAGLYLHFHGGGWALGSIYEQDELLDSLAQATRLTVVSIDYPLAPEHELPDALARAQASARTVMDKYGHANVCLGGESAGAHIAVTVALDLVAKREHASKLRGLNLCYGIYDLSMSPSQRRAGDTFVGLSKPYLEWFYSLALPGRSAEQRGNPAFSPLYRDVAGMPACAFTVGDLDPLLDDTLLMAARWRAAGNPTELHVYPQAYHGFNGLATRMAHLANQRIHTFLAKCLEERRA
jgi:acetyl esterase/lipase